MDEAMEKEAQLVSWPQGISAITLFVEDMVAAKAFYQTVLVCRYITKMTPRRCFSLARR